MADVELIERAIESAKARIYRVMWNAEGRTTSHQRIAENQAELQKVTIKALEKQLPKQPTNKQGFPLWGYCPSCGKSISKGGSPIGCKWCLQRLDWGNEDAE